MNSVNSPKQLEIHYLSKLTTESDGDS